MIERNQKLQKYVYRFTEFCSGNLPGQFSSTCHPLYLVFLQTFLKECPFPLGMVYRAFCRFLGLSCEADAYVLFQYMALCFHLFETNELAPASELERRFFEQAKTDSQFAQQLRQTYAKTEAQMRGATASLEGKE
jgi:hypothetical protein